MKKQFYKLLATNFGSGLSPVAPGTIGTLLTLLQLFALQYFLPHWFTASFTNNWPYLVLLFTLYLVGHFISDRLTHQSEDKDPKWIVIDEVVGMGIAVYAIPFSYLHFLIAFALFRLFDIAKPWHVGWADKKLKGASGIMLDDVIAGVYANVVLQLLILFF